MLFGLGKLTQTIISPVQLQQAAKKVGLIRFGLGRRTKTIASLIPADRPNKVGLMGFGQIELDLFGLG